MRSLMQITAATPSKHRAFYLDPARMETLNLVGERCENRDRSEFQFPMPDYFFVLFLEVFIMKSLYLDENRSKIGFFRGPPRRKS